MVPTGATAKSISDLEAERQALQGEMSGVQGQLEANKESQDATMAEINRLQGSIQETEKSILVLNDQVTTQMGVIAKKNEEIQVLEEAYQARKAKFEERLAEIYKQGEISYLEVLLQAESFSDFLTRYEYMGLIASKDQELLQALEESRLALEAERAKLEDEKAHLESLKAQQEQVEQSLQVEKGNQEAVYADLEQDQASLEALLAEQYAQEEAIAGEIYRLQQEEEARRAQEAAAAAAAAQAAAANNQTVTGPTTVDAYVATNGSALWPVPGYHRISSGFGYRIHPIYQIRQFHGGTDIPAPTGTPTVAVKGGKVVSCSYHWSYGNHIVVYHGDGTSSLYAHLSGYNCSPGQTVNAGDVIGYIGSTGASTGAHLHFEMHENGSRVNPHAYIGY